MQFTVVGDALLQWWREQVGLVSQEPVLFDGSVRDNIIHGRPGITNVRIIFCFPAISWLFIFELLLC